MGVLVIWGPLGSLSWRGLLDKGLIATIWFIGKKGFNCQNHGPTLAIQFYLVIYVNYTSTRHCSVFRLVYCPHPDFPPAQRRLKEPADRPRSSMNRSSPATWRHVWLGVVPGPMRIIEKTWEHSPSSVKRQPFAKLYVP